MPANAMRPPLRIGVATAGRRSKKGPPRAPLDGIRLDESGFMLQPTCRRNWARRGRTPTLRCWERHDRLSVIGAVELSPARRRIHMDWHLQKCNLHAKQVVSFVCGQVSRYGRILLVLDRWSVHRSAARQLQALL